MQASPLRESLEAFLRSLEGKNRSTNTLTAYRTDLYQFFLYLADNNLAATAPDKIKRADIEEFMTVLSRRKISGTSRARKLAALREYFRYLVNHELIQRSPAEGLETPKKERRRKISLHSSEYNRLLALAGPNPRDYAIFQVFLQTGIRVSELVDLEIGDIDFVSRFLHVQEGKGKKSRSIELVARGIEALKTYLQVRPDSNSPKLFLNRYNEPFTVQGLRKIIMKYKEDASIEKQVSPHTLRRTFVTEKAKQGMTAFHLQPILGHERLDTTQLYVNDTELNLRSIMEKTAL